MHEQETLKVNSVVESLASAAEDAGLARLEGYVGPSDSETIRLYGTLDMTYFADIPRDAILHAQQVPGRSDGSVQVFMRPETEIRVHLTRDERSGGITRSAGSVWLPVEDVNFCIIICWQKHDPNTPEEQKCIDECMEQLDPFPWPRLPFHLNP
jgi:hypothetical protein